MRLVLKCDNCCGVFYIPHTNRFCPRCGHELYEAGEEHYPFIEREGSMDL